ncbi:MAG: YhbY family RNA-binding protein [Lachnospiraceae bacterium]|nr:YhbY family RNA-binding protein [Lachnospiraceae bacterium]
MTNKQRAFLTSLASNEPSILQIGKGSVTPEYVNAVDEAITKRELVKISVLKNCMEDPHTLAQTLAERTKSEVVRVIGRKIILYRPAKKPVIKLP